MFAQEWIRARLNSERNTQFLQNNKSDYLCRHKVMSDLLKIILVPIALFYGCIILLRNSLYAWGLLKSFSPPVPTVVVGNLSMGGTGKTPHVERLIRSLQKDYKIAVLSRGYGRATAGFRVVQLDSRSDEVGDEPKQIKQKFPDIPFAVCEKRKDGIQELLKLYPDLQLIILDDAMQHLAVSGGFVIMLSEFERPFFKDWVVPMGRLREFAWSGKKRANLCVFTKCPEHIEDAQKQSYSAAFSDANPSFFSRFIYPSLAAWQSISGHQIPTEIKQIVLVTGIANPKPLVDALSSLYSLELIRFADHHNYTEKDIEQVHRKFANFDASTTIVLTTEKDAVKLAEKASVVSQNQVPWFYVPIEVQVEKESELINRIQKYVESYPRSG
jgi:tetraacyldisaccharide 4'-kinase